MNWSKNLKGKLKIDEPLKRHTTFKIGGPGRYFIEPRDEQDLRRLIKSAGINNLPLLVIGGGSNLLVNDEGVNGLVVKLNSPHFKRFFFDGNTLKAGSGCLLNLLLKVARERSLSGLEFLSGIPGTLGGALVMNAGIAHKNIGDLVEEVTVMDYNGKIKILNKKQIRFGYRVCSLSGYIVLDACLKLSVKNREQISTAIKNYLRQRKEKQELSLPSAGCVFKNPKGAPPAGRLIDLCGLKGKRIGGACVSAKHANFIVNTGRASAKDVSKLIKLIVENVKDKFNLQLEPEIKIWA